MSVGDIGGSTLPLEKEKICTTPRLKPPFLRDTENGRNSRNRGVENGKWQVSFSEMIQLIFAQNLSQFGRAFNKMLGKVYLLPTFPSKCCIICRLGSYFCSLNALFGSPVWGNVCRAAILFVYTIDIEYNKRLDRQRPCLEGDFSGGSNNIVQSNKSVWRRW